MPLTFNGDGGGSDAARSIMWGGNANVVNLAGADR